MRIAVFAGDGIGPEVTEQAVRVLEKLGLPGLELVEGDVGGVAYRKHGHPLPPQTLEIARSSEARSRPAACRGFRSIRISAVCVSTALTRRAVSVIRRAAAQS